MSSLGKCICRSAVSRCRYYAALSRFLEDGALPLDDTLVERALRGVSIGRRNFLFAGSDKGAMTAATIYTIVATYKLCGVEPVAYLADVLTKIETGTWPHGRLRELLPDEWARPPRRRRCARPSAEPRSWPAGGAVARSRARHAHASSRVSLARDHYAARVRLVGRLRADAVLDRLVHNAHRIKPKGPTRRKSE